MRKFLRYLGIALLVLIVAGGITFYFVSRPNVARFSDAELSGRVPVMAGVQPESFPTVRIPEITGFPAGAAPRAAKGLAVARFAEGLDNPRTILALPNGDVLVAESQAPAKKDSGGIEDAIGKRLMSKAGSGGLSANRITLLRDADGDGRAEVKLPYITGLNSPYGMAVVGDTLYVANTDALLAFPYVAGANSITAKPRKIADLPAAGTNRHWTKSLIASPDGKSLFVGVGADSNIAEKGMEREVKRAAILEFTLSDGKSRIYGAGLRNPVGMGFHPVEDTLWTVVNERDMLGSDLVPDYLTAVDFGDFYGWPWYYWGGFVDARVPLDKEDRRQYVRRPDYALGAHVAPLGMSFARGPALGDRFANGAFIALHGSWNRVPVSGYSVVFVPFGAQGMPADVLPITVLGGFVSTDEEKTLGRPADAQVAADGSLLVADDGANIIWRVTRAG
ncbi:MAG: sorbosone dehydrogenase family protein [Sphingopyxis sp.]|nr:sorbosone dehydrogenase family protein [Sphingopyxis sp.]